MRIRVERMSNMKEFYKELQGRMKYLESLPESDYNNCRINELLLVIIRVQQILLAELKV